MQAVNVEDRRFREGLCAILPECTIIWVMASHRQVSTGFIAIKHLLGNLHIGVNFNEFFINCLGNIRDFEQLLEVNISLAHILAVV